MPEIIRPLDTPDSFNILYVHTLDTERIDPISVGDIGLDLAEQAIPIFGMNRRQHNSGAMYPSAAAQDSILNFRVVAFGQVLQCNNRNACTLGQIIELGGDVPD